MTDDRGKTEGHKKKVRSQGSERREKEEESPKSGDGKTEVGKTGEGRWQMTGLRRTFSTSWTCWTFRTRFFYHEGTKDTKKMTDFRWRMTEGRRKVVRRKSEVRGRKVGRRKKKVRSRESDDCLVHNVFNVFNFLNFLNLCNYKTPN